MTALTEVLRAYRRAIIEAAETWALTAYTAMNLREREQVAALSWVLYR